MFTLPDLPYAYNALEPYIDEETMRIHHDKHHAAYVKNINDTLAGYPSLSDKPVGELLADVGKIPGEIRQKVINFAGGHSNHVVFWNSLSPIVDQKPEGALKEGIMKAFGSQEALVELLKKTALGRFGSGWAWLVSDKGTLRVIDTANQDSPLSLGLTPLLGIDVWEHAYYLKYRSARGEYLDNLFHVIHWSGIAKTYEMIRA